MLVKSYPQIKVIQADDPKEFQRQFNEAMEKLYENDPEVEFVHEKAYCAYIRYTKVTHEWDSVADEFHAEGIHYLCKQCSYHEEVDDNRKKYVYCKYADYGHTHLDHEVCEMFYKEVKQGKIKPKDL